MEYQDMDDREIIIKTAENGIVVRFLMHTEDTGEPAYIIRVYKFNDKTDLEHFIYDLFDYFALYDYAIKFKVLKHGENDY